MLFLVIFILVVIGIGISVRRISQLAKTSARVLTAIFYTALFFTSIVLRLDDKIVVNIDKIGLPSFIILIIVISASILISFLVYRLIVRLYHKGNVVKHFT